MAENQNIRDAHIYKTERDVHALKERLLEARNSSQETVAQTALIDTLEGVIEQLGKQARLIEDLRSDLTHKQSIVSRIDGGDVEDSARTSAAREFHASSNGDRWLLDHDAQTGVAYVLHRANLPSGGAVTRLDLPGFLTTAAGSPEQVALLRLLSAQALRS